MLKRGCKMDLFNEEKKKDLIIAMIFLLEKLMIITRYIILLDCVIKILYPKI